MNDTHVFTNGRWGWTSEEKIQKIEQVVLNIWNKLIRKEQLDDKAQVLMREGKPVYKEGTELDLDNVHFNTKKYAGQKGHTTWVEVQNRLLATLESLEANKQAEITKLKDKHRNEYNDAVQAFGDYMKHAWWRVFELEEKLDIPHEFAKPPSFTEVASFKTSVASEVNVKAQNNPFIV